MESKNDCRQLENPAEALIQLAAYRIDLDISIVEKVLACLASEQVSEAWQLKFMDSHNWQMVGAPIGLVTSVRSCIHDQDFSPESSCVGKVQGGPKLESEAPNLPRGKNSTFSASHASRLAPLVARSAEFTGKTEESTVSDTRNESWPSLPTFAASAPPLLSHSRPHRHLRKEQGDIKAVLMKEPSTVHICTAKNTVPASPLSPSDHQEYGGTIESMFLRCRASNLVSRIHQANLLEDEQDQKKVGSTKMSSPRHKSDIEATLHKRLLGKKGKNYEPPQCPKRICSTVGLNNS